MQLAPAAAAADPLVNANIAPLIPTNASTPNGIPKAKGKALDVCSLLHYVLHPSPSFLFPSSHYQDPWIIPFPHQYLQVLEHPSPAIVFPSSHYYSAFIIESPQISRMQSLLHPSPLIRLPSSHYQPVVLLLSPQVMFVELEEFDDKRRRFWMIFSWILALEFEFMVGIVQSSMFPFLHFTQISYIPFCV